MNELRVSGIVYEMSPSVLVVPSSVGDLQISSNIYKFTTVAERLSLCSIRNARLLVPALADAYRHACVYLDQNRCRSPFHSKLTANRSPTDASLPLAQKKGIPKDAQTGAQTALPNHYGKSYLLDQPGAN
jgi:hypothetical protein